MFRFIPLYHSLRLQRSLLYISVSPCCSIFSSSPQKLCCWDRKHLRSSPLISFILPCILVMFYMSTTFLVTFPPSTFCQSNKRFMNIYAMILWMTIKDEDLDIGQMWPVKLKLNYFLRYPRIMSYSRWLKIFRVLRHKNFEGTNTDIIYKATVKIPLILNHGELLWWSRSTFIQNEIKE